MGSGAGLQDLQFVFPNSHKGCLKLLIYGVIETCFFPSKLLPLLVIQHSLAGLLGKCLSPPADWKLQPDETVSALLATLSRGPVQGLTPGRHSIVSY